MRDTFEFAHALIPTTLVEGISGMRRRRLHRRAIAALEKLHPEDYKTLAHHCLEASEEPRALDYLIQAAQQARAAFANAEAVANYQQALGLLNELYHGQAQDDPWRDRSPAPVREPGGCAGADRTARAGLEHLPECAGPGASQRRYPALGLIPQSRQDARIPAFIR